jgi:protein ImuA
MSAHSELARLLEHPAIWRGTSVAQTEVLPSGFGALDERLPGGGWPRSGLIEILVSRFGIGELTLFLPALAALTRETMARWSVFVAPPLEPFAPALAAHGVALERLLVVRPAASRQDRSSRRKSSGPLWAFEQSLGSSACDLVMAWHRSPGVREIRRLQLAGERGRTLGVLFRPVEAAQEASHAMLRLALEPMPRGARATLLKSRGGVRGAVELSFRPGGS